MRRDRVTRIGFAALMAVGLAFPAVHAQSDKAAKDGEWPMYNRDLAGTQYSPLKQITTETGSSTWRSRRPAPARSMIQCQPDPKRSSCSRYRDHNHHRARRARRESFIFVSASSASSAVRSPRADEQAEIDLVEATFKSVLDEQRKTGAQ